MLHEFIHVYLLQNDFQVESAAFILELYPYLLNMIFLCEFVNLCDNLIYPYV